MIWALRSAHGWANRPAGPLVLAGLAGVAACNAWLWRKDGARLAARGRPDPLPALEEWPRLPLASVLVAAWNEGDIVDAHIDSFSSLRYPHKELILCAGGADGTYDLALRRAGPQVVVLEQQPGEGKQRALARCLPHARGEVVYLTDADCLLDDDAFERTVAPVAAGTEQAVSGSSRPRPDQLAQPFVAMQALIQAYGSLHAPPYAPGLLGRNCAVSRSLLERSGGLRAPAPTGTDYVLAKALVRAGARIRQEPDSRVQTAFPTTPRTYARQQERWLRNVVLHGLRFGAHGEAARALLPSALGAGMLLGPLAACRCGPAALAAWLLAWVHVLLSRVRYLRVGGRLAGFRLGAAGYVRLPAFALLDFAVWAWALLRYPLRRGRDRW